MLPFPLGQGTWGRPWSTALVGVITKHSHISSSAISSPSPLATQVQDLQALSHLKPHSKSGKQGGINANATGDRSTYFKKQILNIILNLQKNYKKRTNNCFLPLLRRDHFAPSACTLVCVCACLHHTFLSQPLERCKYHVHPPLNPVWVS
jgi:hypothetical protein